MESTLHRCDACLAARVDPPFPEGTLHYFYENIYFQAADWEVRKSEILARDYFRKVKPLLECESDVRNLDIGAGFGHYARLYRNETGETVDIVEPSESCRSVIAQERPPGEVFASLPDIPSDRRYQRIFCFHVAEHLQEFTPFARTLRDRLNVGGELFILTPNGASSSFLELGREWGWACPNQHYQFLSNRIPAGYFERMGFQVIANPSLSPAVIHYPSRWLVWIRCHTKQIQRVASSASWPRRIVLWILQRLMHMVAHALEQNRSNHNLASVEKFIAGLDKNRSQDELLLVLKKVSYRAAPHGPAPSAQNRHFK